MAELTNSYDHKFFYAGLHAAPVFFIYCGYATESAFTDPYHTTDLCFVVLLYSRLQPTGY